MRIVAAVATAILFICLPMAALAVSPDEITAETAVLMDCETGQILFDKDMDKRVYPASTTKIMTGIIAVEEAFPGDVLTVTDTAVAIAEPMSSHIALTPGEELSLDDALFALMMPSANDAANVIAEHVAGSQDAFAGKMNAKAEMIGAINTRFANAHGLHDTEHYTTACDMAIITRYAAGDQLFMRYFGADLHTMAATNLQPQERPFTNYQYMLVQGSRFYNEYVTGGKVGYTHPARHTMSTVAEKDGRTLICVVMGSGRDEKFRDTQKLLDFGFNEFTRHTVPKEDVERYTVPITDEGIEVGMVSLFAGSDISFLLHNDVDLSAVRFDTDFPGSFDKEERISAAVNLVADSGLDAVPSLLAAKTLTFHIDMDALPAASIVSGGMSRQNELGFALPSLGWLAGISMAALTGFAIVISRFNQYKRRKSRLARLNRRTRMNNLG